MAADYEDIEHPIIIASVDGKDINPEAIKQMILNDTVDHLPTLRIDLNDMSYFDSYAFRMGSVISLYVADGDDFSMRVAICKFIVKNFGNKFEDEEANDPTGTTVVQCVHPWEVFKDYTVDAFPPQKVSTIIQTLLENSYSFTSGLVGELLLDDSDNETMGVTYKLGVSEIDLIEKLKNISTVNGSPCIFYTDIKGDVHFSSYKNSLIKKNAKVLLTGQTGQTDVPGYDAVISVDDPDILVGGAADSCGPLQRFKEDIYFLDPIQYTSWGRSNKYDVQSGMDNEKKGMSIASIMRPSANLIETPFMGIIEQLNLYENSKRELYKTSTLFVTLESFALPNTIDLGEVVDLYWPANNGDLEADTQHWMNGKWFINGLTYVVAGNGIKVRLQLIRPGISLDPKDSSVMNTPTLM